MLLLSVLFEFSVAVFTSQRRDAYQGYSEEGCH